MTQVPGLDGATPWLAVNLPGARPPFHFQAVPGGSSNPTFFVTDAEGAEWVLRRPPPAGVLPSAHDMGREFRVLAALHAVGFPVPAPIGLAEVSDGLGAPFYVMVRVDGIVLRTEAEIEQLLDAAGRRRAADDLVSTMAALHELDPEAIGLGDLGRREGYLARQLRRWSTQAEASAASSGVPQPALGALHDRLLEALPERGPTGIVHGDFRIGNVVVAADGKLLAVLDWELCTLGATLADTAHTLVSWLEYPRPLPEGLPTAREMADTYLARTGQDGVDFDYYIAFAAWRLGCILAGVHARYTAGAGASDAVDPAAHLGRIERLAGLGRQALEGSAFDAGVEFAR